MDAQQERYGVRLLMLAGLLLSGCAGGVRTAAPAAVAPPAPPVPTLRVTAPDPRPVCFDCFWEHQDPALEAELLELYRTRTPEDALLVAEMRLIAARVAGDSAAVCTAAALFEGAAAGGKDLLRELLAVETVAFLAAGCGHDPAPRFRAAASLARAAGLPWKADIYDAAAAGSFQARIQRLPIRSTLTAPPGTTHYVLGASAIRLDAGARVVAQVERVARDWLSYQLAYDFRPPLRAEHVLDYHEGGRLRDVVAASGASLMPASGTLAVQLEGAWYAADGEGVFRFEVLPDKLQYPTTRAWNGLALIVDTHGISSLVEPALRERADLVAGCGDHVAKMEAAAFLAARGVDVYFPTDRFVAEVLGYAGDGVLVGSAPVRREGNAAVIGDRPVRFSVAETVVVQTTTQGGVLQYYDAPGRYFTRLATALPLRLEMVAVDGPGQAALVVDRARQVGARAVALRVWTEGDHEPLRAWLAESPAHRAVLFHTVAYPFGVRIFDEFPGQTTFGDARPLFEREPVARRAGPD